VIGHDWGAYTAGRFALWHPERLIALVMCVFFDIRWHNNQYNILRLAIPYVPPSSQHIPVEEVARKYPSFGYQVYFASEASTSEIEANVCIFFIY
jgi:soluble epoxide hydrolase/lipid-phosphate phosphatase